MGEKSLAHRPSRTWRETHSQSKILPVLTVPKLDILIFASIFRLNDFHALRNTLAYASQLSFFYCHAHGTQQLHHDLSIEESLHELFINIYGMAVDAHTRNEPRVARSILFALVNALDRYPPLLDNRKRHHLLRIARMFQELGHPWDCEHILLKIAPMCKMSAMPSEEDPFHLLASSFPTTSMSTRRVLVDRWNRMVGGNHADSNLNLPPLHIAVQHRNPNIILALLSNPNECSSSQLPPSLNTAPNVDQVTVNIEERDFSSRTALFTAVANGDDSCCFALLLHGADANTRDDHGHTALEVAVRGGYLNIVKNLIEFKAHVNPDITVCSSLPLHAAIESGNFRLENFQLEIIRQLLDAGAGVYLRRYTDSKHAIDLAVDRGYHELAESMRQKSPGLNNTPFLVRDPSMSQIVP